MPSFEFGVLQRFAAALLKAGGVQRDEALRMAEGLVSANLRGYDSHGVMRIPYYLEQLERGDMVTGAKWSVLEESPSRLVVDANWGFGHVAARRLQDALAIKALETGLAVGTMRCSGHIGRLGEYAEMAAEQNLVSMLMVNSHGAVHRVVPPGGRKSRLATNPICIGAPCDDRPLVLDFSTSATAEGKVRVKHIAGERVPDGWLVDSEGNPTNDPAKLYADPHGGILPFGGAQAYKGFGLSLMVEILTGALSGGFCSRETPETPIGNCVFMLLLSPERFGGAEHFADEVSRLAEFVRSCPTIDEVQEILLPGDPERRTLAERQSSGIPVDEPNWEKLAALATRLDVELPPRLGSF